MRTRLSTLRLLLALCIALAFTASCTTNSSQDASDEATPQAATSVKVTLNEADLQPTFEGTPTSFGMRKDSFAVGYYVKDGITVAQNSLLADEDAEASSFDLDIVAEGEGFNAVIATGKGTDITLTGTITATDEGDGQKSSDFSGLGAMVVAADYAKVTMENMTIDTKGFLRAGFITDNHANIMVKNTTLKALGANPLTESYKEYVNSANQAIMLSPPWVLGIQGGIRGGNMLGDNATLSVIDSSITVGGWAVISTDACTAPVMNVVDTTMEILPESKGGMSSGNFSYSKNYGSGYGTYFIGNSVQNFIGVTMKGLTYGGIYTGGTGLYKSSKGSITLNDADGNTIETFTGKGNPTTIDAVWGFMTHGSADVTVTDGTVVNAEESIFLHKRGGTTFTVDNAILNAKSGVLLQMIDNDDSTVGGSMAAFNTEFNEKAGWPSENGSVTEPGAASGGMGGQGGDMGGGREGGMPGGEGGMGAPGGEGGMGAPGGEGGMGAPGGDMAGGQGGMPGGEGGMPGGEGGMPGGEGGMGAPGGDMAGGPGGQGGEGGPGGGGGGMMGGQEDSGAKLILANGDYKGDIFNGSGYWGQSGNALEVSVEKGATLTGAISLTETRHVDETGEQNTHFTINEYYYLGHVANRNYRNETAEIAVELKDGGVWTVTGEGLISKLTVDGGTIKGADGKTVVMTVDGKKTEIQSGKTYEGDIVIALQ